MADAPHTLLERERKLEVPPGFELPPLPGEPLAPRTFTSTYLDTPDRRLARAGVTLRRRTERGEGVWQLELPHDGDRVELEAPGDATPPDTLTDLLVGLLRGRALEPFAVLRTHRRGVTVRNGDGPVAEVVHDRVSVLDGYRIADRFEELEIEAVEGDGEALDRIEAAVTAAGAHRADPTPKPLRTLRTPEEPLIALPGDAEVVRAALATQAEELVRHDPGTRLGIDSEELHRFRVATRRLRAILRTAMPMLEHGWASGLRLELAWLGSSLGPVRDLDVLCERLEADAASLPERDRPGAATLLARLGSEREAARETLLAALAESRYFRLLDALEDAGVSPKITDPDASLAHLAASEFRRLEKAARALRPDISDERLHRLRVRAKRARYAAELAEPVVGPPAAMVVARAKRFQDAIGEHQDAVVAEERLRALAETALDDPAAVFAAGQLVERQRERRRTSRAAAPKRWRALKKAGREAWPR
jgi:CHAD domain-containing protein